MVRADYGIILTGLSAASGVVSGDIVLTVRMKNKNPASAGVFLPKK